ncbi:hypothetical protein V3C99_002250 [Haemonchus contortus]|uniref:Hypotheticial protein n=1 Tax=Haemonchus contortus TaxID=6289 RepID=A0A7I4YAH7_HAECO|nr:unnamed protein product [Haemonchus contortus]
MFLLFCVILSVSCTFAQRTDSYESNESTTSRSNTNSSIPTIGNFQRAINSTIDNLNEIISKSQNERNIRLYRLAIDSLNTVRQLDYDRETLRQLASSIRRLNAANTVYSSGNCNETSSEIDDDYDDLYDDLNDDDSNGDNDSNQVERVKRIVDAAREIIEDYCD